MHPRRFGRPPARGRNPGTGSSTYRKESSPSDDSNNIPLNDHEDNEHGNSNSIHSEQGMDEQDSLASSSGYEDGVDAIEAQQYIHDLDDELEEDAFDLDDIRQAIDYNDLIDELDQSYREPSAIVDELPMSYFDDADNEAEEQEEEDNTSDSDFQMSGAYPESSVPPSSNISSSSDHDDQSEEVLHKRLTGALPSPFQLAMGLWCIEAGVSRAQYKSLRDILHMVPHPTIRSLPESLQTLHRRTRGHLPILPMRKQSVKLALHKLSTETAQRRLENQQNTDQIPRSDMYFFDMKELFRTILQSDVKDKMYRGMMEWRNKEDAVELWQSTSWGSSNKTTSGHFAHDPKGAPVFVSDMVEFICNKRGCYCKAASAGFRHFGRIRCVGINQRKGSKRNGKVELEIQECISHDNNVFDATTLDPPLNENEIILTWIIHFVVETNVFAYDDYTMTLDYKYADEKLAHSTDTIREGHFIRRTLNVGDLSIRLAPDHDFEETPLCKQAPLRGELEIETYGRQYFLDMDEYVRNGGTIWSIPYLSFIDGKYLISCPQRIRIILVLTHIYI